MTSATLHQGWPGDSACNLLVLSTDEGEAKFFWADAYYNKVKDQWDDEAQPPRLVVVIHERIERQEDEGHDLWTECMLGHRDGAAR